MVVLFGNWVAVRREGDTHTALQNKSHWYLILLK